MKKGTMAIIKARTARGVFPIWKTVKIERPEMKVLRASHPWSNNKPRGLELPVFLACLPSALSRF